MDNKAVQYQNPAHVHTQADVANLTADLAAKASNSGTAGGPFLIGQFNLVASGFEPRPYTFDPSNQGTLVIDGGDYTAEFPDGVICCANGGRYLYLLVDDVVYDADSNQTQILFANADMSASSGLVVNTCSDGLAGGFGNTIAAGSTALGQVCTSTGRCSLAAGLVVSAEGPQAIALGFGATAFGGYSAAIGNSCAAGDGSCAIGAGQTGAACINVSSVVGRVVSAYGDVRSRVAYCDTILVRGSNGEQTTACVMTTPSYAAGVTTFMISDQPSFPVASVVDTHFGRIAFACGSSQASGNYAHAEGAATLASGLQSHSEGDATTASADSAHAEGAFTTASAQYAHAEGYYTTASAAGGHTSGCYSVASKLYQRALSSGRFSQAGDSQYTETVLRRATTDATPMELTLDVTAPTGTVEETSNRFICATGKSYACLVMIVGRKLDGTSAFFLRQALVKNVSGTVSLEGAVQTIGVDINPADWPAPAITADNTAKSLAITVTGTPGANIRWSASVHAQEVKI